MIPEGQTIATADHIFIVLDYMMIDLATMLNNSDEVHFSERHMLKILY